MVKKIQLNFQTDKPNLNNQVYSKNILEKALTKKIEEGLPILINQPEEFDKISDEDVIGIVTDYVNEDGTIIFNCEINSKKAIELIEQKNFILTTGGIGHLEYIGLGVMAIQDDFEIRNVFLTSKNTVKKKPHRITQRPDLSTENLTELGKACQVYIDFLDNDKEYHEDGISNYEHQIFEEAMILFFPDGVWDWINERRE